MRVIFFSKKQNLTMEGGQEKTVCVEGKFRVTSYITLISTAFISHLLAVSVFSIGCISTHGAAVGKNS